jgi:branched-subunit amino acid aminotransferase/4-amino-4-deoxychorismate lyase
MTTTTAITYVDGKWVDANAPLWSSMSHGVWLSSMIFDGARAFEGVTPDLDLHCQRAVRSAGALGLRATMGAKEIEEIDVLGRSWLCGTGPGLNEICTDGQPAANAGDKGLFRLPVIATPANARCGTDGCKGILPVSQCGARTIGMPRQRI